MLLKFTDSDVARKSLYFDLTVEGEKFWFEGYIVKTALVPKRPLDCPHSVINARAMKGNSIQVWSSAFDSF